MRSKPLITFKKRKTRLDFPRKKKLKKVFKVLFSQMKPRYISIRMMGRDKFGERMTELLIQSVPHHGSNKVEAALGQGQVRLPMEQSH